MKIKSIELCGFKTFVDKVTLYFPPGITAVVGPNGCGKSNIVDAFRWVMGEQSARQLRGKLMEDVIFNGSDTRKPMGMAEVSITISLENGGAPPAYSHYSELMVTRRLFRSGESEYSINKVPCRLKDIAELFLDTGSGPHSYSIIEQGNVEYIINSKPLERRSIIDEVAGICKYKMRRKEALSKIESTKQNLMRIDDIINEVKRQLDSIKRQSSKLKRYQELKEEIKKIELTSSLLRYSSLKKQHEHLRISLDQYQKEELTLSTHISSYEAGVEGIRLELTEEEKIFTHIQEEIYKTSSLLQKEETRAGFLEKEIFSLKEHYTQLIQQKENNAQRQDSLQKEITHFEQRHRIHLTKAETLESALKEKEAHLHFLKQQSHELDNQIEQEKAILINLHAQLAQQNNQLTHCEEVAHNLQLKIEHNRTESENLTVTYTHLEQEISRLQEQLLTQESSKHLHEKRKAALDEKIDFLTTSLRLCDQQLIQTNEQWGKLNSRLSSLEELQKNYEDCDAGVRAIMLRKEQEAERNGVCGLVVDFIETDPRYETALEAILGEKLHYVVVQSQLAGVEALEYLKAHSAGRVGFVPIHLRNTSDYTTPPILSNGEAYPFIKLVKTKEEYQPIVDYLLNEVVLVDNLTTALKFWNSNGIKCTLVTLDGEIIDPAGIITGGPRNGMYAQALSKRREINELRLQLSELQPRREQFAHQKQTLMNQLSRCTEEYNNLQTLIHQEEMNALSLSRDINQLTKERDEASQKKKILYDEHEELLSTLTATLSEFSQLKLTRESTLTLKHEKETFLAELQNASHNLHQQIESAHGELTSLKVQFTTEKEKGDHLLVNAHLLHDNLSLLSEEHLQLTRACTECEQKQKSLEDELILTKTTIEQYQHALQDLEQYLGKIKERLVEKETLLKEKEDFLKKVKPMLEEVKGKINELTLHLSEISLTTSHLIKEIAERYQLNLDELLSTTSSEDTSEDEETSLQRLAELKKKIESLGDVNLAAAQEEEELTQRYQFLTQQRTDLVSSLESLNLAIAKINRTTKQRFLETFHMVNDKFKTVFPELFQGGRGELRLTEEDNLLETGIEVVAQPPGKRLQVIDLLSGGEKALTAFALLMAIFLVKPSPFCLLDEADSALDDTNALRFNNYLKRICQNSQFILITHNKLTMQAAHTLYGITMEEPGVSKVVSVQLQ